MEHSPERELKLAATADFHMPSIYGLVGPVVRQAPPERNETTYYDTTDLRLARWGASLRHRPGEGWEELYARADRGLYLAKRSGRGLLAWNEELLASPLPE